MNTDVKKPVLPKAKPSASLGEEVETLATAIAVDELRALIASAIAQAGGDSSWASWVTSARAKLADLGMPLPEPAASGATEAVPAAAEPAANKTPV